MKRTFEIKRVVAAFTAVFLCFCVFIQPVQAAQVYIQTSLDLTSWEILSSVIRQDVGITARSPEVRRIPADSLKTMAQDSGSMANALSLFRGLSSDTASFDNDENFAGYKITSNVPLTSGVLSHVANIGEEFRVLTFPGQRKGAAQTADYNRALTVNDALVHDLNCAFSMWLSAKHITKTPSLSAFHTQLSAFYNDVQVIPGTDNCRVNGVENMTFRYRIPKGYLSGARHDSTLITVDKDTEYVNWAQLSYEAFYNYMMEGNEAVTQENVYGASPGALEQGLVSLFGNLLDGLRGLLGLWSMDELLFSTGIRENGYVGGIFPVAWESTVWTLFVVMEVLAAMLLLAGLAKNLLNYSTSTVNFMRRLRAMEQVQSLIVCAVCLALLPLGLRILLQLCGDFTQMVYGMVPDVNGMVGTTEEKKTISQMVIRFGSGSGGLAGVLVQFAYLGIEIYMNFFYAVRSITVAILIIIAPVMIALIAVSDARSQMTLTWAQELLANILIQPIHAFVMAVILLLPNSSHGFDNLIAMVSLIPLTAVIRSFFFGTGGSFAHQVADSAKQKASGALQGMASAGLGALAVGTGSVVASALGGKGSGKGGETQSKSESGRSTGQSGTELGRGNTAKPQLDSGQEQSKADGTAQSGTADSTQGFDGGINQDTDIPAAQGADGTALGTDADASAAGSGAVGAGAAAHSGRRTLGQTMQRGIAAAQALPQKGAEMARGLPQKSKKMARGVAAATTAKLTAAKDGIRNTAVDARKSMKNSGSGTTPGTAGANPLKAFRESVASGNPVARGSLVAGRIAAGTALAAASGGLNGAGCGGYLMGRAACAGVRIAGGSGSSNRGTPQNSEPTQETAATEEAPQTPNTAGGSYADTLQDTQSDIYQRGLAQHSGGAYTAEGRDLTDAGIRRIQTPSRTDDGMNVEYDFSKMGAGDLTRAQMMMDTYQNGTEDEKELMRKSGINSAEPVTRMVDGEEQTVGMRMNVSPQPLRAKHGMQLRAGKYGGSATVTPPEQNAPPQLVPDVTRTFASDAAKGKVLSPGTAANVEAYRAAYPTQVETPVAGNSAAKASATGENTASGGSPTQSGSPTQNSSPTQSGSSTANGNPAPKGNSAPKSKGGKRKAEPPKETRTQVPLPADSTNTPGTGNPIT